MLSSLLVVALTAAPPSPDVAVVSVIVPRAILPATAERIEDVVRSTLATQGVVLLPADRARAARKDAQACRSKADCLADVGRSLGAGLVVRVEASTLGQDTSALVQVFSTAAGALLAEVVATVPVRSLEEELPKQFDRIVAAVVAATARPTADRPVEQALVPPAAGEPGVHLQPPADRRRPVAPWLVVGGGVAAGIAGGVFAILGASARATYLGSAVPNEPQATRLTLGEKNALVAAINTDFTVALSCAIAAAVLAVAGLILFAAGGA